MGMINEIARVFFLISSENRHMALIYIARFLAMWNISSGVHEAFEK